MINIEKCIDWFEEREGKVTYSMPDRNGPDSYDCSSAVYFALRSAGAKSNGWAVSTESEHDWLLKNGFECVAKNECWTAKRGDIFIWGKKGQSGGEFGHTGIFVSGKDIIHCNFSANGISIGDHDTLWTWCDEPYFYAYRLKENAQGDWEHTSGGWKFKKTSGNYCVNEWQEDGLDWFYFNKDGLAYEYSWLEYNGKWYYFGHGGRMVKNQKLTMHGKEYFFDANGICLWEKTFY